MICPQAFTAIDSGADIDQSAIQSFFSDPVHEVLRMNWFRLICAQVMTVSCSCRKPDIG